MKSPRFSTAFLGLSVMAFASGCGGKKDSKAELESAANKFVAESAAVAAPAATGDIAAAAAVAPSQQMREVVDAYKGGKLEDAVTRLQNLRATPTMTGPQRMALNDATAVVMNEIYALAAKGDQRAVQAVKQYEKLQTQRR
jgi:hypothetical protein